MKSSRKTAAFFHKAEIVENATRMQTYMQFSYREFFISSSSSRSISIHTHKEMLGEVRIEAVIQKISHCQFCWVPSRDEEKHTTGTAKDRVLGKTKTFTRRLSRWMDFKTFFISHCWEMLNLKNHSSTSAQGFNFFFYRRNESYWFMQLLVFWRRLMGPLSFSSPCHICRHHLRRGACKV